MSRLIRRPIVMIAAIAVLMLTSASLVYALTVSVNSDGFMYACYSTTNGDVRLRNKGAGCPRGYAQTRWYGAAPKAAPAPPKTTIWASSQDGESNLGSHGGTGVVPPAGGPYLVNGSVELVNMEPEWVDAECTLHDVTINEYEQEVPTYHDTVRVDLAPAGEGGSARFVTLQAVIPQLPKWGVFLECYDPDDWLVARIDVVVRHAHISVIRADTITEGQYSQ